MSEPNNQPATGASEIDGAELAQLQADSKKLNDLNDEAKSLGYKDHEAYLEFIEDEKFNKLMTPTPAPAPEPTPKPAPAKEPEPAKVKTPEPTPAEPTPPPIQPGMTAEERDAVNRNARMTTSTYLKADWLEHKYEQDKLPEDQKSVNSKASLQKAITSKEIGGLIQNLAPKFDGNLFRAADHYLTVFQPAKEEDSEAKKALDKAKDDANLPGGQAPKPEPKPGDKSENELLADDICP